MVLIGEPVIALRVWPGRAGITEGPVFRTIDRWVTTSASRSPQSVDDIPGRTVAGYRGGLLYRPRSGYTFRNSRDMI